MERIEPESSWNDKPTPAQLIKITQYCKALGIHELLEETPTNRLEARNLIYQLLAQLKGKHAHARHIRVCNK